MSIARIVRALAADGRLVAPAVALLSLGILGPGCKAKAPVTNTDAGPKECDPGEIHCAGTTARICDSTGHYQEEECDSACVEGEGCVACVEGRYYCNDNWVSICRDGQLVPDHDCGPYMVCQMGECMTRCDSDSLDKSNVGCEFYAVDLDNEAVDTFGMSNDAAAQQFAVVVANTNDYPVQVTVYKNSARFGEPIQEEVVVQEIVQPMDLVQLDLPQREVDGCMGQNGPYVKGSGSGTFVSSHAYKILASGPVVAYQFNPIIQQFSNDASILLPRQALGQYYIVLGWPTTNPCGPPPGEPGHMDSIPDHTAVTVVGVEPDTHVTVIPTHPVTASGGDSGLEIPETPAGTPIEFTIGPYDVVNLESLQAEVPLTECLNYTDLTGDFTGTIVRSDKPVAVFTSLERGIAGLPEGGDTCCTDHLEAQLVPVTALGWKFVVSRSPVRSTDPGWREPDVYRILATEDDTTITTNLPDHASFRLNKGEVETFWSDRGFVLQADGGAVMVGQILISQNSIPQGGIGDPTLVVFPSVEQFRKRYVFLVPTTFEKNYMVLTMPTGTSVRIDGQALDEFQTQCVRESIGELDGQEYEQMTCRMEEGTHTVEAGAPVGLTVYGYYNVGSYGYAGGSDVRVINPVE